jgi:hypothetical protein
MNDSHTQREPEDAVDWYLDGASKMPGDTGSQGMEPKPAAVILLGVSALVPANA